jgi:TrmH family RNA methyltransferase
MGNLGTISRTMLAFNFKDLALIRPAVDVFDPRAVRSSMGAVFKLNFQYFNSFDEYREAFSRNFYPFMTNGKTKLNEAKFEAPYSLIFGNEGAGLGDDFLKIGQSINIPISSQVDSLNLASSVSIALYQASR